MLGRVLERRARCARIPLRALVTGAAGFIGSQLVERLLAAGYRVVGIDDFDDYYSRAAKRRNLRTAMGDRRFQLLQRDVMGLDAKPLLKPGTVVFHLAGQPGVRPSWGHQFDRYVRNNVLATQRLLESARRQKIGRFVYASSSSVYGAQPDHPLGEETLPHPISPYGVTKLAAEHLCRVYQRAYGVPTVALRFFTVYGSRQRPDMAFHRFFEAARHGRPISVLGDGSQRRDFSHVSDIVTGLVAAAAPDLPGEVYNLGGGFPVRLSEAIRLVEEVSGHELVQRRLAGAAGDPSSTWADTTRAAAELGYHPKVGLRAGLQEQWAWHDHRADPAGR